MRPYWKAPLAWARATLMPLWMWRQPNGGAIQVVCRPRHSHGETLSGAMVGDERGSGTSWDLVQIGRGAPVQVRNTRPIRHDQSYCAALTPSVLASVASLSR